MTFSMFWVKGSQLCGGQVTSQASFRGLLGLLAFRTGSQASCRLQASKCGFILKYGALYFFGSILGYCPSVCPRYTCHVTGGSHADEWGDYTS